MSNFMYKFQLFIDFLYGILIIKNQMLSQVYLSKFNHVMWRTKIFAHLPNIFIYLFIFLGGGKGDLSGLVPDLIKWLFFIIFLKFY